MAQVQLDDIVCNCSHRVGVQGRPQDVRGKVFARSSVVSFDALPHEHLRAPSLGRDSARAGCASSPDDPNAGRCVWTRVRDGDHSTGLAADRPRQFAELIDAERFAQRDETRGSVRGGDEHAVGGDDVDMGPGAEVGSHGVQDSHGTCPAERVPQLMVRPTLDRRDHALHDSAPKCPRSTGLIRQRLSPLQGWHQHPVSEGDRWQSTMRSTDAHRPPGTLRAWPGAGHGPSLGLCARSTPEPEFRGARRLGDRRLAGKQTQLILILDRHHGSGRPRAAAIARARSPDPPKSERAVRQARSRRCRHHSRTGKCGNAKQRPSS